MSDMRSKADDKEVVALISVAGRLAPAGGSRSRVARAVRNGLLIGLSCLALWSLGSWIRHWLNGAIAEPLPLGYSSAEVELLSARADWYLDATLDVIGASNLSKQPGAPTESHFGETQPSQLPIVDPEWDTFPRSEFSFGWWISVLSPTLRGDALYRHKKLNHDDIYIPRESRKAFQVFFLDSLRPQLEALESLTGQIGAREANELFDVVPHRELTPTKRKVKDSTGKETVIDMFPLSSDDPLVIMKRDGKNVGIPVRSLPGLRSMNERRAFLILEIGHAVALWFRSQGVLSGPIFDEVMEDVSIWSENTRSLAIVR